MGNLQYLPEFWKGQSNRTNQYFLVLVPARNTFLLLVYDCMDTHLLITPPSGRPQSSQDLAFQQHLTPSCPDHLPNSSSTNGICYYSRSCHNGIPNKLLMELIKVCGLANLNPMSCTSRTWLNRSQENPRHLPRQPQELQEPNAGNRRCKPGPDRSYLLPHSIDKWWPSGANSLAFVGIRVSHAFPWSPPPIISTISERELSLEHLALDNRAAADWSAILLRLF